MRKWGPLLSGRLDILRMSVETQEQAEVALATKRFGPFEQGRLVKSKKSKKGGLPFAPPPLDPSLTQTCSSSYEATQQSVPGNANVPIESLNTHDSRTSVVFRTETPRTHRDAPPCRRPGYLYWPIWLRNCRSRNSRRRQRHRAPRKWPGRIYYHLQGRRLQTI